ncbi:hypothetical protein Droror1_Dr00027845 [Drosera rotundifolia]
MAAQNPSFARLLSARGSTTQLYQLKLLKTHAHRTSSKTLPRLSQSPFATDGVQFATKLMAFCKTLASTGSPHRLSSRNPSSAQSLSITLLSSTLALDTPNRSLLSNSSNPLFFPKIQARKQLPSPVSVAVAD